MVKKICRLKSILNFAVRLIFGRCKFSHISDPHEKLGWLSPRCVSDYQTLVIAHKVIQLGEPEELAALFVTESSGKDILGKTTSFIVRDRDWKRTIDVSADELLLCSTSSHLATAAHSQKVTHARRVNAPNPCYLHTT